MNVKKLVILGALIALAAVSLAQPGGGGGMRGGFGGPGGGNPSMLLQRDDVQSELKITDDQKAKLSEFNQTMMDEGRAAFQEASSGGGRPDQAVLAKVFAKLQEKSTKELAKILTPEQSKRLKELWFQRSGNGVVLNKDVQKELGITADQLTKITDLQKTANDANRSLFEKVRSGEIDREEVRSKMEKNQKVLNEAIGKLLTDAQKAKIKEASGAPFTFKEDAPGG